MNIPEKAGQIKTWLIKKHGKLIIITIVLIISNIASFSLGRQSILINKDTININNNNKVNYSLADPEIPQKGSLAAAIMAQNDTNREEVIITNQDLNNETTSPRYVASRKGRVYYFTWCSGAKNISTENRVYYKTANDARAVGLTPSKACPDLD
jgi:hypothetical protein